MDSDSQTTLATSVPPAATCACFTGHRRIPRELVSEISTLTDSAIKACVRAGYTTFIAGGAPGYDTIAACRTAYLRKAEPELGISLWLALPCRNQSEKWRSGGQLKLYKYLLGEADRVIYLNGMYFDGCMKERNEWMVNHSTACIAYCNQKIGGAAQTLRLALQRGSMICNIAEFMKAKATE